ncbi:MAG: hypothetical protein GW859_03160 [Sphingomonadales bacterium]|nr:hypothetical protein [Sphingomonadales bacterium]
MAGALFIIMEWLRMRHWPSAVIEGLRMWGFMAISLFTIWFAVNVEDAIARIGIALVSPIIAALIVNNSYMVLRQRLTGKKNQ